MKKLIGRLTVLLLVIICCMGITWIIPGTYPHDLAALVNKKEMLKNSKKPRIIFIGGSSILSLKSDRIAKQLNRTVINMGLWGGLSTRAYLTEIKPFIADGDVIVVTCEYATMLDPKYVQYIRDNIEAKKFFMLMSPERHIRENINNGDYRLLWDMFFDLCQMKAKSFIQNVTTLNADRITSRGYTSYNVEFDKYGSRINPFKHVRPLDTTGKEFTWPLFANHELVIEPFQYVLGSADYSFLNDFSQFAKSKNALMLVYFSHFPIEEYTANKEYIYRYCDELQQVAIFPIINTPDSFAFPREYFADTIYHLNDKGEQVRSDLLARFIVNFLK